MRPDWWQLQQAAAILAAGGIVAHATEAVWGLACDPWQEDAVMALLAVKDRPWEKGLILIAASPDWLAGPLAELPERKRQQVLDSWPGANTWLLPNPGFPPWITGRYSKVAVRVPGHAQARALCRAAGGFLVSTSANRAGRPPARTDLVLRLHLGADIDYVLAGRTGGGRAPSRIRDAETGVELRAGG